jgi:hypothetical protein
VIGPNKHGSFAGRISVDRVLCEDHAVYPGIAYAHALFNAGEPGAHLIDDMSVISPSWFGQTVWDGRSFFGAGVIRDQLGLDYGKYDIYIYAPERTACVQQCEDDYFACLSGCTFEDCSRCDGQRVGCITYCDRTYRYDW